MCVVCEDGRMERLNNALGQSLGQATSDLVGTRFIDNVYAEDRDRVEGLLSALAQDGTTPTSFDARLSGRDGSLVWIEWRAAGDDLGTLCLVGRDVSSRKVTEQALHREEDFVTLLQIAAVAANEASSLEEALEIVVAAVCVRRKLPLGHAYLVAEPGVLASSRIWHIQEEQRFTPLIEASQGRTYLSGEGVPGTVLKTGQPLWVDVATDPNFLRREEAQSCGVRAAFAFPITLGPEVLGVLEFFSTSSLEPDEGLLEVMKHVGGQLGHVAERGRAQAALRDTGERARRIVETANDAFVGMDRQGSITEWNSKAESLFGWSHNEVIGRSLAETIVPAQLRAAHETAVVRYLDSGNPTIMNQVIELPALHRDGHEIPIELTVWPLAQGEGLTFNAFLRDVTERRNAQEEIARARDFAETVVSSTVNGVFAFDTTMKLTEWNPAMERISGIGRLQALRQNASEVLSTFVESADEGLFRSALEGRGAGFSNVAYVEPDTGASFFYDGSFAPLSGKDGNVVGGVGLLHDITERKLLEDRLRATSERISNAFSLTFNNALNGMAMVRLDGHFEQVNPALCSLLGRSEEELLTTTTERITHENDVSLEVPHVERILSGAVSSYQIEKRLLHSSGQSIWVLLVVSVVADTSGRLLHLIHQVADITSRKRAEEQLVHQAMHDSLTGVPNRTLLLDRLEQALARSQRWSSGCLAVMFVDFDRFKVINDSLGHQAGDRAIVAIARRLEGLLRPSDTVARFGGDEFVILCEEVESVEQAREIATRIGDAVAVPIELGTTEVVLSASIGIALSKSPGDAPEALVRDADAAMYKAKQDGRGRHEVFDESLRRGIVQTLEIENELRAALESDQLRLYYQPQISVSKGRVVGAEALIRWQHPTRGLLGPIEFIQIAEESGLIVDIDTWVVQEGCRRLKRWEEQGWGSMSLSVNVSAQSLSRPEFGTMVRTELELCGSPSGLLCLEITERVFMGVGRSTLETIAGLRELGVELALDDFGTGYSSLSYLSRFPVDVLKVDRSFVQGIGQDSGDSAITATVITLAHNMDLAAVAEGVETEEQLDRLKALGCDLAQGFHLGRPQPPEDLERFFAA
jgi:diguanylate cyclase (GGDEF)-like protein/PAS domain S-box-containing protein